MSGKTLVTFYIHNGDSAHSTQYLYDTVAEAMKAIKDRINHGQCGRIDILKLEYEEWIRGSPDVVAAARLWHELRCKRLVDAHSDIEKG